MPTVEEVRAELARRERIAEVRAELARRLAAKDATEMPDIPPRAVPYTSPERQAEQVSERAQALGRAAALQKAAFIPKEDFPALKETEISRARREIEERRGKVIVPGVEEPVAVEREGLPFFRPTEIREEPIAGVLPSGQQLTARVIRDPETGEMRDPTAAEEAREAFARQTIMGEEEARRIVMEGGSDPMGILAKREAGEGVVETTAAAALRSFLTWGSATLGEGFFEGLGYEVDEDGNPVDPDDFGLAVAEVRKSLGIPDYIVLSDIVTGFTDALGPLGYITGRAPHRDIEVDGVTRGLAVPLPGVATERKTRKAYSLDPTGIRQSSDVAIPAPLEDWDGFKDAETRRIAQNVAAGRSIGDEFRDAPELAAYYADVWGDPDMAYWVGLIPEMLIPGGPGFAAKWGAIGAAGLSKGSVRLADAAYRTADDAAKAMAKGDPEGLAHSALRLKGMALEMANTPGMEKVAALGAFARPGVNRDLAVTKKIAESVVRANRNLTPEQSDRALAAVAGLKSPDAGRAVGVIDNAVRKGLVPDSEEFKTAGKIVEEMQEQLRLNMPGDYVQVTETMAVPRRIPGDPDFANTVRKEATQAARLAIERQPLSKRQILQFATEGNLDRVGLGKVAAPSADVQRKLNALAEAYWDAQKGVPAHVPVRTPKLDKEALRLIKSMAPERVAQFDKEGVAFVEGMFRSNRISKITETFKTGERAAIENMVFPVRDPAEPQSLRSLFPLQSTFDDLPPRAKRVMVETLKKRHIETEGYKAARRTSDLTALQMYARDVDRRLTDILRWAKTPEARKMAVLMPGYTLQSRRISSVQQKARLKRVGREASRIVERELKALTKDTGSVDRALDALLQSSVHRIIRREVGVAFTPTATEKTLTEHFAALRAADKEQAQALWRVAAQKMYPNANQEELAKLMEGMGVWDNLPTVEDLAAFDKVVKNNPGITPKGYAPTSGVDFARPQFHKVMLDLILDKAMKPILAGDSQRVRALIELHIGDAQAAAKANGLTLEGFLSRPDLREKMAEYAAGNIFPSPVPGKISIPHYGADTKVEKPLAEGGVELVEFLEAVAPKHRRTIVEVAKDAALYLAGPFRRNAIQAGKYGYVVPNLPFWLYKGIETPFKAAVMVGVDNAAEGMTRAAARAVRGKIFKRQTYGGGITTPDGVRYSGDDLLRLAEQEGIGYSAITANRVTTLADDVISEVERVAGGPVKGRGVKGINPAQKSFYIRTAEALERSVRQGVFEARLVAGDTIPEAAEVARASQFDFDKVPGPIRDHVARAFQGAAEGYALVTEMVMKGIQNPQHLTKYLKALEENRQRQDPYGIAGDQALTNLIISGGKEPDSPSYAVPIPGSRVLTNGLAVAAYANNAAVDLRKFWNGNQGVYDTFVEIGMESGGPILWSGADALLPDVLDAFDAFEPIGTEQVAGAARPEVSSEKMMWAHALMAANADPTQEPGGAWETFNATWEPIMEPPPANRAMPEPYQNYWRTVPPGMPYLLKGRDADLNPLYVAMKPSKRGELLSNIIRSATPEMLTRLGIIGATYGIDGKAMFEGDPPEFVHAKGVIKDNPLMDAALNPTGINFNDPKAMQEALAERVLVAREVTE